MHPMVPGLCLPAPVAGRPVVPRLPRAALAAGLLLALPIALSAGCASSPPRGAVAPGAAALAVSFTDQAWNGQVVPNAGRCQRCGGGGMSPALLVSGLPAGTEAVVVEFNDLSSLPVSRGGGHGAVRVPCDGREQVAIPSFKENSDILPEGVLLEHRHRCVGYGKGAYLGPCSESNNLYEATVEAVRRVDGKDQVLATGTIKLGRF